MTAPDPELVASIQQRAEDLHLELRLKGEARLPIFGGAICLRPEHLGDS